MRFQDRRVTFGSKITDRIWKDNNGQLICYDCVLSRTGYYDYLESDIIADGDPTKIVKVFRTPEEVFDEESLASFENKPFCNDHPDEDVTTKNSRELQCGYIRNVRRGEGDLKDCVIADVIVTDQDVIDLILSGEKRQLSLGYDSVIEKDANGRYLMKKIRGNHLALVDEGRAGCATIRDKAIAKNHLGGNQGMPKSLFRTNKTKLYDEDIIEVEEIDEDVEEVIAEETQDDDFELEELNETSEAPQNDSPSLEEVLAKLSELEERVAKLEGGVTTDEDTTEEVEAHDEDVEGEEVETEDEDIEEETEVVEDEDVEPEEVETEDEDVEEFTDECESENTLLDADEELEEKTEEVTKKQDKAVDTYSKFANASKPVKNTDSAIKKAGIEAWKKRYGIK